MPGKPGDQSSDDDTIPDDAKLLRRIAPGQVTAVEGNFRPRSDAFSNSPDGTGTSVDIWEEGREPKDLLVHHENFGLVWLTAREIRESGLGIVRNELPNNRHHALIQGKKTKGTQRKLANAARWIELPKTPE